ncbi:MAG: hypothetical protein D3916_07215 [Candidatus Electrothrix sp. MAN1_4]|nr:hypothetical protein [Candidatus Electrothrix sp. MAN1_4]
MGRIFKKNKKYTFSDYFDLSYSTKDVLEEFGYSYRFEELVLPGTGKDLSQADALRRTYTQKLPYISMTSEAAKREFYISPLLLELLNYVPTEIDVEYPLDAGENLSGTVDYLLQSAQHEVVILEAKKGDLEKGFTQLAVELIALDKVLESEQRLIYGAVTLGDVWRFGVLDRSTKTVQKDMNAYSLLPDVHEILAVLIGILELDESSSDQPQ